MANSLLRLTDRLVNTPQLITAQAADEIFDYLVLRNSTDYIIQSKVNKDLFARERRRDESVLKNISENGIAILDVDGPLSYTVSDIDAMCGAVSYQQLEYEFKAAVEASEIHTIVLYIDSPGGEAYGCFELANYMRRTAKEKGKRLVTYVDGAMYSAALALGVAGEEIISNPFADQGSVGVLVRLLNTHKYYKKMGLEESFIFAGEEKIPYDAKGDFKKEFIDDLQAKVDGLYKVFVSHVATHTGMSEKAVIDTKARTFNSDEAMKLGLVNKVMEREQFFNYLADRSSNTRIVASPAVRPEAAAVAGATDVNSTGVIEKSDEDNLGMKPEEIQALQDQLAAVTAENQRLQTAAIERAKGELKTKLSGFGIKEESLAGLTEVVSTLKDTDREILFGVFAQAKTDMAALATKVKELETKTNADMFQATAARGDSDETEGDQTIRQAVQKNIAAKVKQGETK